MGDKETTYTILKMGAGQTLDPYQSYIIAKWLRSYRFGNDYIKLIDQDAYFYAYATYIDRILSLPNVLIRIAVLTEDTDVALGFSVSRANVLDYLWVQKDQRDQGIGTNLIPKGIDTFTHLTKAGLRFWPRKLSHAKFNPFI
jgi:hypothetical protein